MKYIRPAFGNACFSFFRFINPNPHSHNHNPSFLSPLLSLPSPSHSTVSTFQRRRFSSPMADGGGAHPASPSSLSLEKQFEELRLQLEESGGLRERIRTVVSEIESTTRLMHASLLLVHHSRPTPGN